MTQSPCFILLLHPLEYEQYLESDACYDELYVDNIVLNDINYAIVLDLPQYLHTKHYILISSRM